MNAIVQNIADLTQRITQMPVRTRLGRLKCITGPTLRAGLSGVRISDICKVDRPGMAPLLAEVSGIVGPEVILTPFSATIGLQVGAIIRPSHDPLSVATSDAMLGRVVDAFGHPIDDLGPLTAKADMRPIKADAPSAMSRPLIENALSTGLRVIDGPLTLGRGQRIAIFGAPGTGKSRLLAEIARHTEADIVVIGLVGERGREVREFIDRDLTKDVRRNVVIVAATSDRAPVERAICAQTATSVAEHFRDQGKTVLLMIDSLTRTARALREIGLSAGEAPTRRGYPASVYPALPAIIERSGRAAKGDITAIYTVLTESDGQGDPIAEEVRSLTDGHIVLSRKLAEAGHYPAIDVLESLSRIMTTVTDKAHQKEAHQMRRHLSKYDEIELLIQIGEYKAGGDPEADAAIAAVPKIREFLRQDVGHGVPFHVMRQQMGGALS
ncbi:MAG: FliI/YscN family ATPase [Paracoccaceae bacterium]